MSQGCSYVFNFDLSEKRSAGNSVRFTFPEGFWSNQPTCEVNGLVGKSPKTLVLHNKRIVVCSLIGKELYSNELITVMGMVNPPYSGLQYNINKNLKIKLI